MAIKNHDLVDGCGRDMQARVAQHTKPGNRHLQKGSPRLGASLEQGKDMTWILHMIALFYSILVPCTEESQIIFLRRESGSSIT